MADNDLLIVNEAADCLSLSRHSVYKYIKSGIIPAFKDLCNRLLIPRTGIEGLLAGCLPDHNTCNTVRPVEEG